ncbi:hypothetical protein VPHD69_0270 [Vibrio phage D69]
MDKLVDSMSFSEDWQVTLLEESAGLEKSAAANEVLDFTEKMDKKDGKFYLHINAMGAGEYYGSNRNGDYFPEDNLIQWHKTFETSPAHVFRHHVNKDPSIAIGKVIYSYYNPRMHRVELIAEVDKELGRAEYEAISRGEFPMTSMACNTPYDVCSICNNRAHNRAEYCSHLTTQLNQTMPDGRRVMSLNVGPLKFFDISIVIRPADITSSVLQKVASNGDIASVSSAEAAELEGVTYGSEKQASIKKLAVEKAADLLKEIPGEVEDMQDSLGSILKSVRDPEDALLDTLKPYHMSDIISTFAALGINPSLKFLIKIIAGKEIGQREDEIADAAIDALETHGVESIPEDADRLIPDLADAKPNPYLIKILSGQMDGSSYKREYVEKRASHTGYVNWQAGRGEIRSSAFFPKSKPAGNPLLTLAGAAIIAKIMISTIVGRSAGLSTGVEKSAELTVKLMDLSVRNELKGMRNV